MAERFSKLYSLTENQYVLGSPVIIKAGALLLDNVTVKKLIQLKFLNIGSKIISSLSVSIKIIDDRGVSIGEPISYTYMDLKVKRDVLFGSQNPIYISCENACGFTVEVKSIKFSDDSEYSEDNTQISHFSKTSVLIENVIKDDDALEEYRDVYCHNAKYALRKEYDIWCCSCGAINHDSESECHVCGASLQAM